MYWISNGCDGCGVCADSCPYDLIARAGDAYEIGIGCNLCGACSGICPTGAIKKRQ